MKAIKINFYDKKLLSSFQKKHFGRVLSVFEQSINLEYGKEIININTNKNFISPFGINISEMLNVKLNDLSYILNDKLIIQSDEIYELSFNKKAIDLTINYSKYANNLFEIIRNEDFSKKSGFSNKDKLFIENNMDKAYELIDYLLGRGIGLTPSGDDFLSGILFTQFITNNKFLDFKYISDRLDMTNKISKSYLQASLDRQFNYLLVDIYKNLHNKEAVKISLKNLEKYGHTSSYDLLFAIQKTFQKFNKI